METVLTKTQVKTAVKHYREQDTQYRIKVNIRYDDECSNGHNTFAITADIDEQRPDGRYVDHSGGCCHDEIVRRFPEFAHLIKWHLCSSDEPLHYIANTIYHVKEANFDYARSSAIWPEATNAELLSNDLAQLLAERLPTLMAAFQADIESLGFTF